MQSPTTTAARVTSFSGQQIGLNDVRSIRLADGWHSVDECELTYQSKGGQQKTTPVNQILGFSDKDETGDNSQS